MSQVLRGKKAAGETPNSSKAENVSKVLEGAQSAELAYAKHLLSVLLNT
jgi:hypothetical protein